MSYFLRLSQRSKARSAKDVVIPSRPKAGHASDEPRPACSAAHPQSILCDMTERSPYLHKTQYYETDQMGVVHHSNYIRWFEEARTDLLERAGLGYDKMEERGIIVPVLAASCEYKSSVRYGETVAIIPNVDVYTGLRLTLTYRVVDASTGELRSTGETRHAFLDRDFRPSPLKRNHPDVDELMRNLAQAAARMEP